MKATLFVDATVAGKIVGLSASRFIRKYASTELIKQMIWKTDKGTIRRRMFLRSDVEKLT